MQLYLLTSQQISELIAKRYSTSFYTASKLFGKEIRNAIFSIYGFVRVADEIVDTFHGFDRERLLQKFEDDYYDAYHTGISINPVLHSFQMTVKTYQIPDAHIQAFIKSMKADLGKLEYKTMEEINDYIYGSADVVGLMCLKVFCKDQPQLYEKLEIPAMKLGSAFQKVNFLRDLKHDIDNLHRSYLPLVNKNNFDERAKAAIIKDIEIDFESAYLGIKQLPSNSRLAVSVAYWYFMALLKKLKFTPAAKIISQRLRISNPHKAALVAKAIVYHKLNLV